MQECKFCQRIFSGNREKHSVIYHEKYCQKNSDKDTKVHLNQYSKAKLEGRELPKVSEDAKRRRIEGYKNYVWTPEKRALHSQRMREAVKEHPESYTSSNRGRTKEIIVDGIKLHGQWEVDFYKWAKEQNLNPIRPFVSLPYVWHGERQYYPDFYIETLDLYIEVKGYETERDRAKWSQFPKKLRILKAKEISQIRNRTFTGL